MRGRLLLGLLVALAAASPSHAQTEAPPAAAAKAAPLSAADLAFGRNIALIRGHLITGDQLAAQRDWRGAATHYSFPREEVYGLVRADLRIYKVPPFDDALRELANVAKARNAKALPKAREKVERALEAADASLKTRQQNWARFVVAIALSILKTAPDEYDDAVQRDRVVRPVGYQTARGYVLQAERMFQSVAGEMPAEAAPAIADAGAGFAELKAVQASVVPPRQGVLDSEAYLATAGKIESAIARLP